MITSKNTLQRPCWCLLTLLVERATQRMVGIMHRPWTGPPFTWPRQSTLPFTQTIGCTYIHVVFSTQSPYEMRQNRSKMLQLAFPCKIRLVIVARKMVLNKEALLDFLGYKAQKLLEYNSQPVQHNHNQPGQGGRNCISASSTTLTIAKSRTQHATMGDPTIRLVQADSVANLRRQMKYLLKHLNRIRTELVGNLDSVAFGVTWHRETVNRELLLQQMIMPFSMQTMVSHSIRRICPCRVLARP